MVYRRRPSIDHDQLIATKDAIKTAFKSLRKSGFIARSNFWCCQGCGCVAIAQMAEKKGIEPKDQKYIFYHQQDNAAMIEDGNCDLAWGGPTDGKEIQRAMQEAGLTVSWDGTRANRFNVSLAWLPSKALEKISAGA